MTALLFNAFVMNTGSHIQHGLWRHPEARQADFNDVDVWIELARTLEAGLFDAAFFADVVGLYGPVGGDYTVNVREGLQIPSNDPSVLLSALAVHTEHLGLAFTSSVLQAHPFEFARRASTLDHISKGRIAWNIVTSTQENAARNFGFDRLTEHDERYEWAQEYLDVVYKLWEGSWDDGALLKDRHNGVFSDHSRIHHVGKRYRVEGPHLPSPSPQRTPLLFQAGSSPAGRAFAARNAEAQFISTPNPEAARELIAETRDLAEKAGRRREDIKFFQGFAFVIGSTEEEARRKEAELDSYVSVEGFLVLPISASRRMTAARCRRRRCSGTSTRMAGAAISTGCASASPAANPRSAISAASSPSAIPDLSARRSRSPMNSSAGRRPALTAST